MELSLEQPRRFAVLRNRALWTLMLGHFTVDMYSGVLPLLYPILLRNFDLDLKTVGLVTLAYTGTASLSQPFFGWVADRFGTRFIGIALIWTATLFATIGFAPTFPILLLLAALAGFGSGTYHPFGALNVSAVTTEGQRNTSMSVYVTGGTVGFALGPLIGAALFSTFGLRGTAWMFLPGTLTAVWMLVEMRTIAQQRAKAGIAEERITTRPAIPVIPLIAVIAVMMSRSWTMNSLQAFIPTWYESLGYDAGFYGALASVVVLGSAAGTLGTGSIADRFGRRGVIIGALILTIPAILLFAQFTGPIAFVTGALIGFTAASTGPLMLVMAQQLMIGRAGVASGLLLGLGFVTGALGVPVTGALADAFGIQMALRVQVILVIATIGIAWFLPTEKFLRSFGAQPDSAEEAAVPEHTA